MHYDIARVIVSSLIHGLIYATIFKAFHHLSLASAAAVAGVGLIWLFSRRR